MSKPLGTVVCNTLSRQYLFFKTFILYPCTTWVFLVSTKLSAKLPQQPQQPQQRLTSLRFRGANHMGWVSSTIPGSLGRFNKMVLAQVQVQGSAQSRMWARKKRERKKFDLAHAGNRTHDPLIPGLRVCDPELHCYTN